MNPMKRHEVRITEKFEKDYARLSAQDRARVSKAIAIIEEQSPEYPSLETKKITRENKWNKKQLFESRASDSIRLIWYMEDDGIIYMNRVGHHDVEKMRKVQGY